MIWTVKFLKWMNLVNVISFVLISLQVVKCKVDSKDLSFAIFASQQTSEGVRLTNLTTSILKLKGSVSVSYFYCPYSLTADYVTNVLWKRSKCWHKNWHICADILSHFLSTFVYYDQNVKDIYKFYKALQIIEKKQRTRFGENCQQTCMCWGTCFSHTLSRFQKCGVKV